jgi:hypothetical protein
VLSQVDREILEAEQSQTFIDLPLTISMHLLNVAILMNSAVELLPEQSLLER